MKTPRLSGRGVFAFVLAVLLSGGTCADIHPENLPAVTPSCDLQAAPADESEAVAGLSRVVDGDTLRLADGRRVRLIGVNTPEINPGGVPEPLAVQARDFLRVLLNDDRALIFPGTDPLDNHGRTLAHVFDPEGKSVEAALIEKGLGWHVAIPPNLALADCLSRLEDEARAADRGVWRQSATPAVDVDSGGFHRVRGRVTSITFATDWWISLENHLVARVLPQYQRYFDRKAIAALEGRTVEVRGWVYPGRGGKYEPWRVNLHTPGGLFLPGD